MCLNVSAGDFGFRWQYIAGTFSIISVEVILQLRLYAMYHRSTKLIIFTGTLCLVEAATVLALIGKSLVAMDVTATGKVSCCTLPDAPFFGGFWGPILGFETLLFGLALYKGYQNSARQAELQVTPGAGSRLIDALVKDSVVYFLVIFAVFLVNFIVPFVDPLRVEYVVEFAMAFSSIMGNRILLSIRSAFADRQESTGTVLSTHISVMHTQSAGRISEDAWPPTANGCEKVDLSARHLGLTWVTDRRDSTSPPPSGN